MRSFSIEDTVGVLGAGRMGLGIAQIAAQNEHETIVFDVSESALTDGKQYIEKIFQRLVEKKRLTEADADAVQRRLFFTSDLHDLKGASLVIEAVVEDLAVKRECFAKLEQLVEHDALLATNTSSLSVTELAGSCSHPERVLGLHFFNPAPLLPLVEVVETLQVNPEYVVGARALMESWRKTPVVVRDTPGFIVNRIARPFYSESLRLVEEQVADCATIDWALREVGGFKMGPFELMDLIGIDVNFAVTQIVFEAFYYDGRFRPSQLQQQMVAAGRLGRKSGRGFFEYDSADSGSRPAENLNVDPELAKMIVDRVVALLVNAAADAVLHGVASPDDIEVAMTKGVNYPKGLLAWGNEVGLAEIVRRLEVLQAEYGEERYRPCVLLRRMAASGVSFVLSAESKGASDG